MTRREREEHRKQARFLKLVAETGDTGRAARKSKASDQELEAWFNERKFHKRFVEARAKAEIAKHAVLFTKILPALKRNAPRARAKYAKTLSKEERRAFAIKCADKDYDKYMKDGRLKPGFVRDKYSDSVAARKMRKSRVKALQKNSPLPGVGAKSNKNCPAIYSLGSWVCEFAYKNANECTCN